MGFNQGMEHQEEMKAIESKRERRKDKPLIGKKLSQYNLLEKARGTKWYHMQLEKLFKGEL